jgi:putative transposase
VLKQVDEAMAEGFSQAWVCQLWGVFDDRVHRWRQRLRETRTLIDQAPGGNPAHGLLAWEEQAVLELAETWGEVDRSHRKVAHRGSSIETVWVSPSTVRRVLAARGLVLPEQGPASRSVAARGPTGWCGRRIASGGGT